MITNQVDLEVQQVSDEAMRAAPPASGSALLHLYSETVDPTSIRLETEQHFSGNPRTMVDAINGTLHEEMRRDPRIVVFGEDVADCSREEHLGEVKGKGGVFKVTDGLQTEFGSAPRASIRPSRKPPSSAARSAWPRPDETALEIQFFDYIWPAMMQIRDELATSLALQQRLFGADGDPLAIGGYLNGGGVITASAVKLNSRTSPACGWCFRQTLWTPAACCARPSVATIRCCSSNTRSIPRDLQSLAASRAGLPDPVWKAKISKTGSRLTIVTYGAMVQKSLQAALLVESSTTPIAPSEVIDLRTPVPVRLGSHFGVGRKNQPRDGRA